MDYTTYSYIYPPRAEHKITAANLNIYDNGRYIAQPKYNGSCCVVFMNDAGLLKVMNRHNEPITLVDMKAIDFRGAYRGSGHMVLCGELLNKNKLGEDGQPFNQKFIIWDIVVFNSVQLIGKTTSERLTLLDELYGDCKRMQIRETGAMQSFEHLCHTEHKGIYKAPAYNRYFNSLYNDIVPTDLYEGLVLKRADAKLSFGFQSKNNHDWQIKVRKPTKNYSF